MDRRRTLASLLIGLAGLGASPVAPPLREANWIAPDRREAALHSEPPSELTDWVVNAPLVPTDPPREPLMYGPIEELKPSVVS